VALLGVGFANILMFTQLGLMSVLFDGITLVHEQLSGDLFIVSAYSRFLGRRPFPQVYLYQADAVEGVESASALYIGDRDWVDPEELLPPEQTLSGEAKAAGEGDLFPNNMRIIAFNLQRPVLNNPEVVRQLDRLSAPDSILFDRLAQPTLGPVVELYERDAQVQSLLGNRRVYVVGLFDLGSTLFDKGNAVMSDYNYARRTGRSLDKVGVGVLTLSPGSDLAQVQQQLQSSLPDSIKVVTKAELVQIEKDGWAQDPSGKVLGFGAVMGFIVGVIVVYQVLYTDVTDHLPEYATLKAMGYSNRRLIEVVLFEAMLLALLGFVPGFGASIGVYQLLTWLTKIPVSMRLGVASQVFLLTVVMCMFSGIVAMRKLSKADPADIF